MKSPSFERPRPRTVQDGIFTPRPEVIQMLLEHGADPNARSITTDTALMIAVEKCPLESVELLLKRGAEVNAARAGGETALYYASFRRDVNLLNLLLDRGAGVNPKTNSFPILICAVCNQPYDRVKTLIDRGADVNAKSPDGQTALFRAAQSADRNTIQLLLRKGADVNAKCPNGGLGNTALKVAFSCGHMDIARLLVAGGAKE